VSGRGAEGLSKGYSFLFPFAYSTAVGAVWVAFPLRAIELGAEPSQLGGLGTAWAGAMVASAALLGRAADRIGHPKMAASGALLGGLLLFVLPLAPGIHWLFPLAGLMGVAGGAFWPALEAWVGGGEKGLAGRISAFNIGWSSGLAVGSFVGGFLTARAPVGVFPMAGGVLLGLALLCNILRAEGATGGDEVPADPDFPKDADLFLRLARMANFSAWFTVGVIRWLFPKLAVSLGVEKGELGLLLGTLTAAQALTFFALGRTKKWQYELWPFWAGQAGIVGGLVLLWRCSDFFPLAVALGTIGVGTGTTYTMSLFYSLHGRSAKGGYAGLHEAILQSGALAGPITGGAAAQAYSLRAPALVCIGVVFMSITAQAIGRGYARKRSG